MALQTSVLKPKPGATCRCPSPKPDLNKNNSCNAARAASSLLPGGPLVLHRVCDLSPHGSNRELTSFRLPTWHQDFAPRTHPSDGDREKKQSALKDVSMPKAPSSRHEVPPQQEACGSFQNRGVLNFGVLVWGILV